MKVLELFSGTQSISKQFVARGHETFTVEFDPYFADITSFTGNVLDVTPEMIIERFGKPDAIWASPPCTKFSVAACSKHWVKEGNDFIPRHEEAIEAQEIVKHTLYLIEALAPKVWFIENPRGMLRKMPFMQHLNDQLHTVTYCQYGDTRMKPTDIWTNHPDPQFKPICKNGMPCHQAAPRGSRTGTQGLANARLRSVIPPELCKHIVTISESMTGVINN